MLHVLQHNAPVDAKTNLGNTPLMFAAGTSPLPLLSPPSSLLPPPSSLLPPPSVRRELGSARRFSYRYHMLKLAGNVQATHMIEAAHVLQLAKHVLQRTKPVILNF